MKDDNRPHLSTLPLYFSVQLANACLIALSPRALGRVVGNVALLGIIIFGLRLTTGQVELNYLVGCMFAEQTFSMFLFTWLTDPIHDFRHECDHVAPKELPFVRRVWWALCLLNSPRGIGWSCKIPNLPPRPSEGRWPFVQKELLSAFRWFLLIDVSKAYQRTNQLFSRRDMDLWPHDYLVLPVNIDVRFVDVIGMIALRYLLLATISVVAGFSQPRDWPEVYGRWADVYTVRRFWGRTYHQTLRRLTAGFGKACCRALKLQPGTWQSRYMQLYIGFAVSGLLHCGGDLMVDPSLFGASFTFFFLQAVAITFEDSVIESVQRSGIKVPLALARTVGYVWAIAWLSISWPWLFNWKLYAGVPESQHLPISLIDHIVPTLGATAARLAAVGPLGAQA